MNKKDFKALKEIKETVDEMIEDISNNILSFKDYERYYQEYQKLKKKAKESKDAGQRNAFKTYANSLASALSESTVILTTGIEESAYNTYRKELNTDLGIARRSKK